MSARLEALPGQSVRRKQSVFLTLVAGPWLDYLVLATAVLVCFATPLLVLRLTTTWQPGAQWLFAAGFALACSALTIAFFGRPSTLVSRSLPGIAATPLWAIVALGLLLRLAWNLVFPAQPASDAATYVGLASRLVAGEPYFVSGTSAYWPVGYPLFLSAWIASLDAGKAAWLASNFALYLAAIAGIERVARILSGPVAGKVAALLFAVWPNLVANTATPEKEMLIVALLPWVMSFVLLGLERPRYVWRMLAAGVLLGATVLVQPSFQFLPIALVILLMGVIPDKRRAVLSSVVLVLAMAAVIAPWTLRNYAVFERFVLVSTNGGGNLYRANNPLATGGYIPEGAVKLSHLSEIDQDLQGRALAIEWIKSHPFQFARLAVEKQLRFTGDDAAGIYVTLKLGNASASPAAYGILKGMANGFWILAWITLAALCLGVRKKGIALPTLARLPFWLWLYLFALHSVFEGAGKYHIPVAWVLCVLIAGYAVAVGKGAARA